MRTLCLNVGTNAYKILLQVRVHNLNLWLDREGNPKGDRADATLLDAPWAVHTPKLILWAGAEALKATSVHLVLNRCVLLSPDLVNRHFPCTIACLAVA